MHRLLWLVCLPIFIHTWKIDGYFLDHTDTVETSSNNEDKTESEEIVPAPLRRTKVSSISINIPAAGLGVRPTSMVSTSTLDEGGFNEPYPEIKARLKPHDSSDSPVESVVQEEPLTPRKLDEKEIEALYAVPHKVSKDVYLQQAGKRQCSLATKFTKKNLKKIKTFFCFCC